MVLKKIQSASSSEKKGLLEKIVKLQEEVGELAECALAITKASGSQYKKKKRSDLQEEAIDVILVALDIFFSEQGKEEVLWQTLSKKTDKWKQHQLK
jgi:NTP pyrophosphatase (non-canonical NTP hydrolase)